MEHIWAKPASPGQLQGECLLDHTLGVVAAATSLLTMRPALPRYAAHDRFAEWALLAAAFHDLGKAALGFQRRLRGGPPWGQRHEVLSLVFLSPFADSLGAESIGWITAAMLSHHLDADALWERYRVPYPGPADMDPLPGFIAELQPDDYASIHNWLTTDLLPFVYTALGDSGRVPQPNVDTYDPARAVIFARDRLLEYRRLTRSFGAVLDDIGSAACRLGIALRGVLTSADHAASAGHRNWDASPVGVPPPVYTRIGLDEKSLHEHQRQIPHYFSSVLLTAPTGSGKTEAALSWVEAARPLRDPAARLVYVLPYQASMNAMYDRLACKYHYPRGQIGLTHGRALPALYAREAQTTDDPVRAEAQARDLRDLARLHKAAIRVLSPYQLLKAAYRLKGYEAQLTDLAGADMIVDEIHAYEAHRAGLILALFRHIAREFDVRFCVMTATLPSLLRRELELFLPELQSVCASEADFALFRRHRICITEGRASDEAVLTAVCNEFDAGRSVLCCCNTVRGAQQFQQLLTQRLDTPVELLHGGFNARDRNRKERTLTSRLETPHVLVATQVVEVSLDISFDTLFTEPAPLDAILQRFGRVNRKPQDDHIANVHILTQPDDGQGIYNPVLIANTVALLRDHDGQIVDEAQASDWMDRVYTQDIAEAWLKEFTAAANEFQHVVLGNLTPFQSSSDLEDAFYRSFDGVDVLPECLLDEYQTLAEASSLQALELLVSISHHRLASLRRRGLAIARHGNMPPIVCVHYDPDNGLGATEATE